MKLNKVRALLENYGETHDCFLSNGEFNVIPLTQLATLRQIIPSYRELPKTAIAEWMANEYSTYFCAVGTNLEKICGNSPWIGEVYINWFRID